MRGTICSDAKYLRILRLFDGMMPLSIPCAGTLPHCVHFCLRLCATFN